MARAGRSIHCTRCGASIEVTTVALVAPCTSCGHREPVPAEFIREIEAYERQYASSLDEANESLKQAQRMEDMAGQMLPAGSAFKLFGVILVFAVTAGGFAQYMLMNPSISSADKQTVMMGFPIVVLGFALGLPIFLMFRSRGKRGPGVGAGSVLVACPSCGASNTLVSGDTRAACTYCRARLVPSPTVIRQVLDSGVVAQHRAGLSAMRAERIATVRMHKASVSGTQIIVPMLVIFGGLALVGALGSVAMGESISLLDFAIGVMMYLAFATPLALIVMWSRYRQRSWSLPLSDLAVQFRGTHSRDMYDQVAWLNTFWSSTYSPYWLVAPGARYGTVAATVGGYPLLLDAHPDTPYGSQGGRAFEGYRPRLHLLVAAHVPLKSHSLARLAPEGRPHLSALQEMGFTLTLSTSGVLAQASPELIRRFKKHPASLHLLAQAFQSITCLAAQLGPPAAPMEQ